MEQLPMTAWMRPAVVDKHAGSLRDLTVSVRQAGDDKAEKERWFGDDPSYLPLLRGDGRAEVRARVRSAGRIAGVDGSLPQSLAGSRWWLFAAPSEICAVLPKPLHSATAVRNWRHDSEIQPRPS